MVKKSIQDLREGEIVGNDIILNNALLVKAGTKLSMKMITRLKHVGIKEIVVQHPQQKESLTSKIQPQQYQKPVVANHSIFQYRRHHMSELFYQTIKDLVFENRYGLALNQKGSLDMVVHEFETLMDNTEVYKLVYEMKEWDYLTYYHMVDTFILGTIFAHYLKLQNRRQFAKGCLVHDIGKAYIPRDIILKHGRLTLAEYDMVKLHTNLGEASLKEKSSLKDVAYLARQHHERLDGSGYPDGLTKSELSMETRILMIIDVYSAMTLKRSYRTALTSEEALSFLLREEKQFDPLLVRKFMSMLHIYPKDSIVTLSDLSKARVIDVPDSFPYLPTLQKLTTGEFFQIPLNLSVSIAHYGYQSERLSSNRDDSMIKS